MSDFVESFTKLVRHSSFEFHLNKKPRIDLNEASYEFEGSPMIDLNEKPLSMMDDILQVFHPYITNIQDVYNDENCGYQALAVCLGLDEDQFYEYIRQKIIEELQNRYAMYSRIFGVDVNSLYHDLCFFGSLCPGEHWMKMPHVGVLIANKFGVIVHFLDERCSTTIFPFGTGPEDIQHHRTLTTALVNKKTHYVMVKLQGEYPMPLITPYWNFHHNSSAAG